MKEIILAMFLNDTKFIKEDINFNWVYFYKFWHK